jgi:hypothetical protein
MLPVTKFANRQPRIVGSQFSRSAVLVGPTNEKHFIAELPAESRMDISRQQRADKIAQMLDAVHVGNGAGNEKLCHCLRPSSSLSAPNPIMQKPFRSGRKGFELGSKPSARERASTHPARPDAVGQGHSRNRLRSPGQHQACMPDAAARYKPIQILRNLAGWRPSLCHARPDGATWKPHRPAGGGRRAKILPSPLFCSRL